MGFSDLRVINEDRFIPGDVNDGARARAVFVRQGAFEHIGDDFHVAVRVSREPGGDVQRMSAGTGISHSEYNPSQIEPVHFLQIWIVPTLALHPGDPCKLK
jgi:quercetin 2,3-dioxygenase